MRYDFGGIIFGGAHTWRGLFSEFYGMSFRSVKRPKRAYKRVLWPWKSGKKIMFLSFIHIWNILYLQQLKGMQSLDRASPYKTLLTTQPPHPGLPILGDPRTVRWIWRKCLVESRIAQRINVLSDFFKWLLICISLRYDLRLNLSLAEIWQKCYFLYLLRNWHYAEVEKVHGNDDKIKDDEKKDDKPIQGASDTLNHTKSRRDLLVTRLTSFSLRLHMETRIQIFH